MLVSNDPWQLLTEKHMTSQGPTFMLNIML